MRGARGRSAWLTSRRSAKSQDAELAQAPWTSGASEAGGSERYVSAIVGRWARTLGVVVHAEQFSKRLKLRLVSALSQVLGGLVK